MSSDFYDTLRDFIPTAIEVSSEYLGEGFFDHWDISPCPSYFDCGDDQAYGIYPARADGREGHCLFIGTEWECYKVFVELFGDERVFRSADYRLIYK